MSAMSFYHGRSTIARSCTLTHDTPCLGEPPSGEARLAHSSTPSLAPCAFGVRMLGQQIISGLATGSLYALTAIAVVVVFRNTRTINVAQGDFSMIAAFVALTLLKSGLNYYAAIACTVVFTIVLGIVVERVVMRPIADADWLTLFTATLGVYY